MRQHSRNRLVCALRRLGVAILVGIPVLGWTVPAAAYRPFDGTNAAVVDVGEAEIQLQPAGELSTRSRSVLTGPYAVLDYGFAERWEVILETRGQALPSGIGPTPVSDEAMLKYVVQPGALQGKPGLSVATEFGPDRKSTRLNSSHMVQSRMPSSA